MKYWAALIVSLLALTGLKQMARAETSVNVSSNTTGGSNTHVVVNSNVNTSSTTTNSVKSQTNVHIENNGVVKDFNTNEDESVDWQSDDGKSSVKINNNSVTNKTTTPSGESEKEETTITPEQKQSTASAKKSNTSNVANHASDKGFSLSRILTYIFSLFGFSDRK